jgi:hypothetical protein
MMRGFVEEELRAMGIFIVILLGVVVYLLLDIKRTMQKKQARKDSLRIFRKDD